LFLDWGITSALIKYLSQYRHENKPENQRVLIESALLLNTFIGTALSLALYTTSPYIAQNVFKQTELEALMKYSSFSLIGQSLLNVSWAVAVGYERMELRIGTTIVYSFLKSITGPILIYIGYGPIGAIFGDTGSIIISGIIGLFFVWVILRSETSMKASMSHIEGMRFLFQYGYPLFLSALIVGFIPSINNFLLALNVSNELIGNYNAGIRFSALISFFDMPIATVMFPLLSKLENDHLALQKVYQSSVKYTAIIILPVASVIAVLADPLVTILYDHGYEQTPLFVKLYMLSFFLAGFGRINTGNLLKGIRETHVNLRASVLNFVTTIPLSLLFIPRLGVIGLLFSSLIGSTIALAYRLNWVRKNMSFTIKWRASIKTVLAAAVAFIVSTLHIFLLHSSPWIEIITGGLLYLATYITVITTLRILTPTDLDNMEIIVKNTGSYSSTFILFTRVIRKLSGYDNKRRIR